MRTFQYDRKGETVTFIARNQQSADRRMLGLLRGEFDINGKTILAKDRKPKGQPMRKNRKGRNA